VTTGNVTANDTGGKFAVLRTHPAGTRVTAFGFDGSVELTPTLQRTDASFAYALFSADGKESPTGTVTLSNVNLTIYHGGEGAPGAPDGTAVSELNERVLQAGAASGNPLIPAFKATGAFTVANLNDSNVNGQVDADDPVVDVNSNYPLTSGEVDLMRLLLTKPMPIPGKSVTLTVTPPACNKVQIWTLPNKGGDPANPSPAILVADSMAATATFPVDANFPEELWVELCTPSDTVGDVTITMEYAGAKDTVSATGTWAQSAANAPYWPTGYFMNTGNTLPGDCDAKLLRHLFTINGSTLGLVDNKAMGINAVRGGVPVPLMTTTNAELSKFTTMPTGLTPFVTLGIVSFDVTRSAEVEWSIGSPNFNPSPYVKYLPAPPWLDMANDENPQTLNQDNDNDLVWDKGGKATDNLYAIDHPGPNPWYSTAGGVKIWNANPANEYILTDFVGRYNLFDFVRIKTGTSVWTLGPGLQGSRASVYYFWHNMIHIRPAGGPPWTTTRFNDPATPPGKTENEIAPGLINVDLIGG
jgi:hypothetical protein